MNTLFMICSDYSKTITQSLSIMWKGMLAIFIAIGLIFAGIMIMNTVNKKIKLAREARQNEQKDKTE